MCLCVCVYLKEREREILGLATTYMCTHVHTYKYMQNIVYIQKKIYISIFFKYLDFYVEIFEINLSCNELEIKFAHLNIFLMFCTALKP